MMKKKAEKRIHRLSKDNRGMTMSEVLIGFVILTITMSGVYHLIQFSSNMIFESLDLRNAQSEFETDIYKTSPTATETSIKTLAVGDYTLEPTGKYKDKESSINLFETAVGKKLYSLTLETGEGDYTMRVYGFKNN